MTGRPRKHSTSALLQHRPPTHLNTRHILGRKKKTQKIAFLLVFLILKVYFYPTTQMCSFPHTTLCNALKSQKLHASILISFLQFITWWGKSEGVGGKNWLKNGGKKMRKIPQSRPPGLRCWCTLHLKTVSDLAAIVLAVMKPILQIWKGFSQNWVPKFWT